MEASVLNGGPVLSTERWSEIPTICFTATPTSIHTITFTADATANYKNLLGYAVRYTYMNDPLFYYGIIQSFTGNVASIVGPAITADITQLWVGQPEQIVVMDLFVGDLWGGSAQTIIDNINKSVVNWGFGKAYLCNFTAWTQASAGAAIQVTVGGVNLCASSVVPSVITGPGADSVDVSKTAYIVSLNTNINIKVTGTNGSSANLTVRLRFVLA